MEHGMVSHMCMSCVCVCDDGNASMISHAYVYVLGFEPYVCLCVVEVRNVRRMLGPKAHQASVHMRRHNDASS